MAALTSQAAVLTGGSPHYTLLCDLAGNMQDVAQHGLILLCRIAELGQAVSVLRND